MMSIAKQIATELNVQPNQVNAAITLLDEGATVPFIARYRKEATQGLTDTHLRELSKRLTYLRELNDRRKVILTNIKQLNKLTPELKQGLMQADNKTRLEDLYLPFKPKRQTKGQLAIKAGLAPLTDQLFNDWQLEPQVAAKDYINVEAGFSTVEEVLDGVQSILIEQFTEQADLLAKLRRHMKNNGLLTCRVIKSKQNEATKYRDYFDHSERLASVPAHRALAMFRGRNEGFLSLAIDVDDNEKVTVSSAEQIIFDHFQLRLSSQKGAKFLTNVVHNAWKTKLSKSLTTEQLGLLREQAEAESIRVFAHNLSDILMAAPAGAKVTLGVDPGIRTGCKLAVVDTTGKLLHTATIFPHPPQNAWDKSIRTLANICQQYAVELIAIGNGTGSRETDKLVAEMIQQLSPEKVAIRPTRVIVSEAGASVYSASELAANEFPELDVSLRGAISIARRLQDPLAELVKIDPKAIGVGQYQHDVSQSQLSQQLDDIIEDCVNAVGVDLNSASVPLLSRVSGLTKTIAQNIVTYRDEHGAFSNRQQLKKVSRLGPKAFEQAAGFLRIHGGDNPLDASAVHPESYALVEKISQDLHSTVSQVMSSPSMLSTIDVESYVAQGVGALTLADILKELEKPSRDPRPEFKTATLKEGVNTLADLTVGMILEGTISNVANFGAFVDIGVHQDGLVHISSITDKFISDPRDVVKAGQIVKVKVLEVDAERKRISLTMKLDEKPQANGSKGSNKNQNQKRNNSNQKVYKAKGNSTQGQPSRKPKEPSNAIMGNAFADALAKLKK